MRRQSVGTGKPQDSLALAGANSDDLEPHDKHVRIDTLKWLMSKLAPRRYGDRLLVAGDGDSPLQVLHKQMSLKDLTNDQLDALEKFAGDTHQGSAVMRSIPGGFLGAATCSVR